MYIVLVCSLQMDFVIYFFAILRSSNEISASRRAISHCKSGRRNTCFTLFGLAVISDSSLTKKSFVDAKMLGLFSDDATAVWQIKWKFDGKEPRNIKCFIWKMKWCAKPLLIRLLSLSTSLCCSAIVENRLNAKRFAKSLRKSSSMKVIRQF